MGTNISKADIVCSVAGHDSGKYYYVIDMDNEFLYLCDGKTRKIAQPKRKKQKHVKWISTPDTPVSSAILAGETVTDRAVRKDLAMLCKECCTYTQEG